MNIALVILHADPARGGAERYTIDLAAALAARGHAVSLLASSFADTPSGVAQVPLAATGLTRLGRYVRFLDSLDAELDRTSYDIVHAMLPVRVCDLYHPHAGVAGEAIESGHLKHADPVKRRASAIANRLNLKRRRFARVERDLLESANPPVVLCLSNYVKATLLQHYRSLAEDRLVTLFNSVDLSRFDPAARPAARDDVRRRFNLSRDDTIALIIAQDFDRKGLAEAIKAVHARPQPRPALIVVGQDDAEPYRRLARSLGIEDRVVFAGPTDDPYPFYAAADFFVLPTRHDPCSLVVLEALAMGVPVISTTRNGATEIMISGVHGHVLDCADRLDALADAIRDLSDPANRERMRQACLALRPQLAYETHVTRLESIYQRVIDARGKVR